MAVGRFFPFLALAVGLVGTSARAVWLPEGAIVLQFLQSSRAIHARPERIAVDTFSATSKTWVRRTEFSVHRSYQFFALGNGADVPLVLGFSCDNTSLGGPDHFQRPRGGVIYELSTAGEHPIVPRDGFPEKPELVRVVDDRVFYIGEGGGFYELVHAENHWRVVRWLRTGAFHSPGLLSNALKETVSFDVRTFRGGEMDLVAITTTGVHLLHLSRTGGATAKDFLLLAGRGRVTLRSDVISRGPHLWLVGVAGNGIGASPRYMAITPEGAFKEKGFALPEPGPHRLELWAHDVVATDGSLVLQRDRGALVLLHPNGRVQREILDTFPAGPHVPSSAPSLFAPWPYGRQWDLAHVPVVFLPHSAFGAEGIFSQVAERRPKPVLPAPAAGVSDVERFLRLFRNEITHQNGGVAVPDVAVPVMVLTHALYAHGEETLALFHAAAVTNPGVLTRFHVRLVGKIPEAVNPFGTVDLVDFVTTLVTHAPKGCSAKLLGSDS